MSPLPCLVCGTELEPVFPGHDEHQPLNALTFRAPGQFGSRFDGLGPIALLAGPSTAEAEVNVCDHCLERYRSRVALVRSETVTKEIRGAWVAD